MRQLLQGFCLHLHFFLLIMAFFGPVCHQFIMKSLNRSEIGEYWLPLKVEAAGNVEVKVVHDD